MRTSKGFKAVAAVVLSSALMTAPYAPLANAEPLDPPTMVAARTAPAMQLVMSTYSGTVQMKPIFFSSEGKDLLETGVERWEDGELTSASEVVEYVFTRAARDPERYFKSSGKAQTKTYKQYQVGSAFVVTGNGHLVTARHVVTGDSALNRTFANLGVKDFATQEAKLFVKAFAKFDLTDPTIQAIQRAMAAYARTTVTVKVGSPQVSVILGVAGADGLRTSKVVRAEVLYRTETVLDADLALLRVRHADMMPTVSMASKSLREGAAVSLHGFPARATFIRGMSEAALLTPTMASGRVTALKRLEGGIELMQTDANCGPGCSGAPALDSEGNVVGVLVSGAVDGNGSSVGEHYVMPIDVVREVLQSRNVTPAPSLTTQTYNQALSDYSKNYYKWALEGFQKVRALDPSHAYVSRYLSDSQRAISEGRDETPPPFPLALVIGGGAAAAVIATLVVLLVLRRSRKSAAGPPPAQTWSNGDPAGPPPGGTNQWRSGNGWTQPEKPFANAAPNGASAGASTGGPPYGPPPGPGAGTGTNG